LARRKGEKEPSLLFKSKERKSATGKERRGKRDPQHSFTPKKKGERDSASLIAPAKVRG